MNNIEPYIVGITGGSGSGKTIFLKRLFDKFREGQICIISQDNYYAPIEQQLKDENGIENFDIPQSIDNQAFVRDIKRLKVGETVERKEYMFNNPEAIPAVLTLNSAPIIVVEGIFVLSDPAVVKLVDLKIFIEAKDHIRLKRRIIRDNEERGYDLSDVLYRYEKHVTPTYEKYVEPFKQSSDLIIPNNWGFDKAMLVVEAFLKSKLTD